MKTAIILFAGAMFSSTAFAATQSDNIYRVKLGRPVTAQASAQPAPACCQAHQHQPLAAAPSDDRIRAKYGRASAIDEQLACARMPVHAAVSTQAVISGADARGRAKYGRALSVPTQPEVLTAAGNEATCDHACCRSGL